MKSCICSWYFLNFSLLNDACQDKLVSLVIGIKMYVGRGAYLVNLKPILPIIQAVLVHLFSVWTETLFIHIHCIYKLIIIGCIICK